MKVKIEFTIDNEAYQGTKLSPGQYGVDYHAVAYTVRQVAEDLAMEKCEGTIIDHNGNRVGHYKVTR